MSHKTKICHGIKITMFFCILQYWKSELILQCFNPITHCYFRKCFNRALNKDSWLVASKPELSCADYKTGTFLVYGWQYKQSVTKPTENIKAELLRQVCRVTQSTAAPPNQPSPQHTMMEHQPRNCLMPLGYTSALSSSCLSESNAVQLVAT